MDHGLALLMGTGGGGRSLAAATFPKSPGPLSVTTQEAFCLLRALAPGSGLAGLTSLSLSRVSVFPSLKGWKLA